MSTGGPGRGPVTDVASPYVGGTTGVTAGSKVQRINRTPLVHCHVSYTVLCTALCVTLCCAPGRGAHAECRSVMMQRVISCEE